MKEIGFRAKKKNSNDWVYGIPVGEHMITNGAEPNFISENSKCSIAIRPTYNYWTFESYEICEIEQDTISQNIGLKDKNGVDIYSGDIVIIHYRDKKLIATVEIDLVHGVDIICKNDEIIDVDKILERSFKRLEVIGNIYENEGL